MAAQHLAAIIIQSLVRRFLFKKKIQIIRQARQEGRNAPWFILHPNYSQSKIQKKDGFLNNVG